MANARYQRGRAPSSAESFGFHEVDRPVVLAMPPRVRQVFDSHLQKGTMSTTRTPTPVGVYAPPAPTALEPVAPGERIHGLDLLRGWAMFGVLWSNLNDWYDVAGEKTSLDRAIGFVQENFVESRFFILLCVLFGIGFGIQLARASQRGVSIQKTYMRRSAALLAIGLVHLTLIWHGDILTEYALVSFALLLFRDIAPKRQLAWAVGLYLFAGDIINRLRWLAGQRIMVPRVPSATANWIYGHGSLAQIHHQRLLDDADWFGRWGLTTYFYVLALFLAGVWALRSGFFQRVVSEPRTTRRFLAWTVGLTLVCFAVGWLGEHVLPQPSGPPQTTLAVMLQWRRFLSTAFDPTVPMGLAYAALLLLAFQTRRGARLLAPLAATGRVALTTYLTQSVVSTFLFYSFGLKWFGTVGYTGMLEITVVLFAIQMAASTWWLKHYRFGPMEWLWRTLTYGHAPAMRLETAAA